MTDPLSFADDALVDALIMEIDGLLKNLIAHGEGGSIDLLGLPLSTSCIAALDALLGQGEITVVLDAAGRSEIHETAFPGVWWTRHNDESGRLVGMLIEVTLSPDIIRADIDDVVSGARRLPASTNAARHAARRVA